MPFDVSTLTNYVEENENILLTKSIFTARTVEIILAEGTVYTGVKFAEKINLMDTDAIFQSATGCVRTSSGNTSLTQRTVTVGNIAVVEDLCIADLETTYMSKAMAQGTRNNNKIPFEQKYTDLKAATIAKQLEIAVWQGDTTSGNANLKRFDGFIKLIDAAGVAVNANTAAFIPTGAPIVIATGITQANVKDIVNAMYLALPADITGQDDIRIFSGWDTFGKYVTSFTNQNLYNFSPTGNELDIKNGEILIPGTKYILTAVHGLDGTNRLFALRAWNMVAATDLENEWERWELMEDQFKNYLHYQVQFRFGVNVAFPNEIVSFKLA